MIPILSIDQMRAIDSATIQGNVDTGYALMLKAARGLCDAVRSIISPGEGDVAIVCGKGNNGGDGYAAGKLLIEAGYGVMCFGLCDKDELQGEALRAYTEFTALGGNFLFLTDTSDVEGFSHYVIIVDALMGTGATGAPKGLYADVIRAMNGSKLPVIAADSPSGLDNNTGAIAVPCVRATITVAMGFPKLGSFFFPGRSITGRLMVKDLDYPQEHVAAHTSHFFLPSFDELKTLLPLRKPAGSKFDHGIAGIIAGSRGMTGSATLVCKAGLRVGCGMTHLASPDGCVETLAAHLVETVLRPMPMNANGSLSYSALDDLREFCTNRQAICIGPGLGRASETLRLVRTLLPLISCPIVLDADGINAFVGYTRGLTKRKAPLVMTPHRGEWHRIFGSLPATHVELIAELQKKSRDYNAVILLKGNPTIVADPYGRAYILPWGNSGLATAGSGDVLSGIITSLIAQGSKAVDAAILGAYIHGRAGEKASDARTEYSMIASDIIDFIPEVMKELTT